MPWDEAGDLEVREVPGGVVYQDEVVRFGREACERARGLLVNHMTLSQREDFERTACFDVIGSRSGARYTISTCRRINNVSTEGRAWFCALFSPPLPIWDQALAQKMLIETDEIEYLAIANNSVGPSPRVLLPFYDEVYNRRSAIHRRENARARARAKLSWTRRLLYWWNSRW